MDRTPLSCSLARTGRIAAMPHSQPGVEDRSLVCLLLVQVPNARSGKVPGLVTRQLTACTVRALFVFKHTHGITAYIGMLPHAFVYMRCLLVEYQTWRCTHPDNYQAILQALSRSGVTLLFPSRKPPFQRLPCPSREKLTTRVDWTSEQTRDIGQKPSQRVVPLRR